MTASTERIATGEAGSTATRRAFELVFATTPTPLMRFLHRRGVLAPIQEVRVVGRRSGIERSFLAVVAETDEGWFIGHPNGRRAQWVRNLLHAGSGTVVRADGQCLAVRATELHGEARIAAIDAHRASQRQPFRSMYARGRRHILATGTYFRLDPAD
jgi:hypothetical protein